MTRLLLGKPVAESIYNKISAQNLAFKVATVGFANPQWQQYVSSLQKSAEKCGIAVENITAQCPAEQFAALVAETSARNDICAVMVQQPLPKDCASAVEQIDFNKDVDCCTSQSVAKLYRGEEGFWPATPLAVLKMLDFYNIDLRGKNVVIVGRGNAVGKPLALMCLQRNATVTVCHTKTINLPQICRNADVIISACGVAGLITADFVTEKSVVIDVGLSFVDGKTCGDVSAEVLEIAAAASPVPGGVGPVTRAALLENVLWAAKLQK